MDENPDPRKLAEIKRFFRISTDDFPDAARIFNEQLRKPQTVESILQDFADTFDGAQQLKESFLLGMLCALLASGQRDRGELAVIWDAAGLLDIGDDGLARVFAALGVDFPSDDDAQGDGHEVLRLKHLRILGLDVDASKGDVVRVYRDLVKRYHPDALRAQNLPEEQIKHAETILAKINVAYAWLRDAH